MQITLVHINQIIQLSILGNNVKEIVDDNVKYLYIIAIS